jgi:hypothetical protein
MSEKLQELLLAENEELKREIARLLAKKEEHFSTSKPSYSFSKITDSLLMELLPIKRVLFSKSRFDDWFHSDIQLTNSDREFLTTLLSEESEFIRIYKEDDLKAKFIIPILNRVNFRNIDYEIREFYYGNLYFETDKFILKGTPDFFISKGLEYPEKPYFFIQEFKKGKDFSDPEPQLLAEMVVALEISNFSKIRGVFIQGEDWYFVILEKIGERYQYYVSDEFNSKELNKLETIFKNLLFVKNEIIEMAGKS